MSFDPEKITFFAKTDARGANVPFGIKAKDRTRHMYVIGKTGMGKSTLLENMAVQDMQNGEGIAFIDPHGQTAVTLLDYVPEERKDDVLYFAPFDTDCPVAFNVMEDVGPDKRHLVVSGLMSVFKKIWVDAWSARMEYILQNTLLALLEYPDSTLLGVNRMLSDKKYRKKVIDNISDPAVKAFWVDEFLNYNERYMQEAGDSIKNKIGQFTANPLIRNIIGQPKSSFDLRKIMDEKKILIMNLSKGLVGESNANLLGSMLTTRIYLAAMSRADVTGEELKKLSNFYFYVDEFQSFANATFADILSEARKYKLNLTIAHQYVEQMEEEVRNAVFGNVGTIVSFRVGPFDAETLETIYAPQFYAVDICNLGFAQIYLTLMIDGIGSKPFSATTLPPIEAKRESCKQMVVHASRMQFASTRTEVENDINTWMTEPVGGDPGGSSNRSDRPKTNDRDQRSARPRPDRPAEQSRKSDTPRSAEGAQPDQPRPNQNQTERVARSPQTDRSDRMNKTENSKEKKLDDLRSILKTIAPKDEKLASVEKKAERPDQSKQKEGSGRGHEEKPENSEDTKRSDLAAAIKETVKEKPTEQKVKEKNDPPKKERGQMKSGEKPAPQERAEKKSENTTPPKPTEEVRQKKPDTAASEVVTTQNTSLRDALSAVLGDTKPTEPKSVQESPSSTEQSAQKERVGSDQASSAAPKVEIEKTEAPVNEYTQVKNKDPLDPKKLERMMRVTTADKTPLK